MKKIKILLTMIAFVFAVMGAIASTYQETHWLKLNGDGSSCQSVALDCESSGSILCRTSYSPEGTQVFDLDGSDKCVVTIYKP